MMRPSPTSRRLAPALLLPLALLVSSLALPAGAQEKKPSTPFQGFSSDNDKPVNIKADQLETHQDEQKAIFTGNVVATQGESTLTSEELTVFYEAASLPGKQQADAAGASPAKPVAPSAALPADASSTALPADASSTAEAAEADAAPAPDNKVKKLVAKGNVVVTAPDQKATGDDGILDMETNIATLTGQEVVMTQGCNVLRGKKLVVNTQTGRATVTGGTTGHFVSGDQKC
ncbi:LptA/OstA family protein [Labrys sp. 22185]|uniref:LptA/OstA family protein n=1 Tax=Labrys sp. 22185 TaxID=3453888 RepID=UPI003F85BEA3